VGVGVAGIGVGLLVFVAKTSIGTGWSVLCASAGSDEHAVSRKISIRKTLFIFFIPYNLTKRNLSVRFSFNVHLMRIDKQI
jgi:hypothetical protein